MSILMAFFPNLSRCMKMFDLVVVVRRGQLECFSASICCATTKNDLLMPECKFCLLDVLHARDLIRQSMCLASNA